MGYIEENTAKLAAIAKRLEAEETSAEDFADIAQTLEKELGQNPYLDYVRAVIHINAGEIDKAEAVLLKSLEKYRFFQSTYLMLMQIYRATGKVEKVFKYYVNAVRFVDSEEEKSTAVNFLKDYINELIETKDQYFMNNSKDLLDYMKSEKWVADYTDFPLDTHKRSLLRRPLFVGRTNEQHFLNLYKTNMLADIDDSISNIVKTEMLQGEYIDAETVIKKEQGDMIAVSSAADELLSLTLETKERSVKKKALRYNRFYYFNVKENGDLKISANKKFFLSHLKPRSVGGRPKLVLNIFTDSLSFAFVKKEGFDKLMPNTYKFFSKGFVAEDCHATGEWTHPSVMSISTGKYVTNHNNFHGSGNYEPELYSKLLQEHFAEAGYIVTRICGNWRLTPSMGYYKKTDRFVYCPMAERMYAEEIVMEALEHLESFKDFNNCLWLTVEDLHEAAEGIETGLLSSVLEDGFAEGAVRSKDVSVYQTYDVDKINHYRAKIRRIDFYLGILFRYLEANYKDDELLVSMFSDHGVSFLTKDETMFKEERSSVPLLLRGRGVSPRFSKDIVSTVDIYPTLLKLCGMESNEKIDGRLMYEYGGERREFVYTESLYPNQTYKVAVRDYEHVLHFEAGGKTGAAGLVDLSSYTARLLDRRTGRDVTKEQTEKVEKYLTVVYEHVKAWLKFW